jgi:hypothetical protein
MGNMAFDATGLLFVAVVEMPLGEESAENQNEAVCNLCVIVSLSGRMAAWSRRQASRLRAPRELGSGTGE